MATAAQYRFFSQLQIPAYTAYVDAPQFPSFFLFRISANSVLAAYCCEGSQSKEGSKGDRTTLHLHTLLAAASNMPGLLSDH